MNSLKIEKYFENILLNSGVDATYYQTVFQIGTAYGIIQILAQDLGIKTGLRQRDLIHWFPVQFFLLFSAAFVVTNNFLYSFITVFIYYYLKYVYSENETSAVCFENV